MDLKLQRKNLNIILTQVSNRLNMTIILANQLQNRKLVYILTHLETSKQYETFLNIFQTAIC